MSNIDPMLMCLVETDHSPIPSWATILDDTDTRSEGWGLAGGVELLCKALRRFITIILFTNMGALSNTLC